MKKILVPTDFSTYANKAVAYAAELARKGGAEIVLMHACELLDVQFSSHKAAIREHNRTQVEELTRRLAIAKESVEQLGAATVSTRLYKGPVVDSVLEAARSYRPGLIVMGTLGQTGLRRKLLGSKVSEVINRSTVPVLTVPHTYELSEPKKILLAIDELPEGTRLLKPVFELAGWFGAHVEAMVFTQEEAEAVEVLAHTRNTRFIEQALKRSFKNVALEAQQVVGSAFLDTLRLHIAQKDIDLVAMITRKRTAIDNLFNPSLTRKMSYQSPVPLLSLHVKEVEG